ncbi:MAG: hypothetical protein IH958_04615 [Chloroflexi bacterium]|nr:hypothetical protein [Chloroflexota bacterium]
MWRERSPQVLSNAKEAVLRGLDLSLADGLALEARLAGMLLESRSR